MAAIVTGLLIFAELALAQFVAPPTNLTTKTGHAGVKVRYKEVPTGICEQNPNVKSYSGYADVGENQHIFWWFFEARNGDPKTKPLTLWINGGPGTSSTMGLFDELGPCSIDSNLNAYDNPYSWSNVSNILFIDQPVTTGLSYTTPIPGYYDSETGYMIPLPDETCPEYADPSSCGTFNLPDLSSVPASTPAAAPNFYLTLQGFTGAFPQYSSNGVIFATESYGGRWAPIFSRYILEQNKLKAKDTAPIDLRAVMIGNGWYNASVQYESYYKFMSETTGPGGANSYGLRYNASMDAMLKNNVYGRYNCLDFVSKCNEQPHATYTEDGKGDHLCEAAESFCSNLVEGFFDYVVGRDEYDIRELEDDPFMYDYNGAYLNSVKVQEAIGAFVNFTSDTALITAAFTNSGDQVRELGVTSAVEYLIDHNVTFLMYYGDADYICNIEGGNAFTKTLNNIPAFTNSVAGFTNISTSDGIVHGQVKQAGKFSFVRVYQAGHLVPFYQPVLALELLNRTIQGLDIQTGKTVVTDHYVTHGTAESEYVEGNGTVVTEYVPVGATYNHTTNRPDLPSNGTSNEPPTGGSPPNGSPPKNPPSSTPASSTPPSKTPPSYGTSSSPPPAKTPPANGTPPKNPPPQNPPPKNPPSTGPPSTGYPPKNPPPNGPPTNWPFPWPPPSNGQPPKNPPPHGPPTGWPFPWPPQGSKQPPHALDKRSTSTERLKRDSVKLGRERAADKKSMARRHVVGRKAHSGLKISHRR